MTAMPTCAICGGTEYTDRAVLWDALAEGWGLTPAERRIVDRQQGTCCTGCGGNLRSIALADAILAECGWAGTLADFVASEQARALRVLEINEAGFTTVTLSHVDDGLAIAASRCTPVRQPPSRHRRRTRPDANSRRF